MLNTCVDIKNVSLYYSHQQVISDLDIQISHKKSLFLSGRNGSGKSSLMNVLAGLAVPSSGALIFYNNNQSISVKDWRTSVAYCANESFLCKDLTVDENLNLFSSGDKWEQLLFSKGKRLGCPHLLDVLEAGNILNKKVSQLSLGEMQKAKLLRCFLSLNNVLLLDEPCVGLDTKIQDNFLQYLRSLQGQVTMIVSSHQAWTSDFEFDQILNLDDY